MSIRYIIEGNVITQEETVNTQMGSLSDLLPRLTSYTPLDLNPLPKNIKYIRIEPRPNMELHAQVIIEHEPILQRFNYKPVQARVRADSTNYRVHLPYGFFWFDLNGSRISDPTGDQIMWRPRNWGYLWGNQPFSTLGGTQSWGAMFPNCWANGAVCFGTTSVMGNQPLGHFIDAAINTFWTTEFNTDLDNRYPYPNMSAWQEAAEADAGSWENWDMWSVSTGRASASLLDRLNNLRDGDMTWREAIPDSTQNEIPELRIIPTFANVSTWLDELDPADRARLEAAINA